MADWERIIRVAVTGLSLCMKHELEHRAKAGRGAKRQKKFSLAGRYPPPAHQRPPEPSKDGVLMRKTTWRTTGSNPAIPTQLVALQTLTACRASFFNTGEPTSPE
jgi:hypothetical protein